MNKRKLDLSLYVILDTTIIGKRNLARVTRSLIEGGATIIQLREPKDLPTKEFSKDAMEVKKTIGSSKVKFIINDRVDIAFACNADGVHLGPDDSPIPMAREILGNEKIIGASVHTVSQAKRKKKEGADYLGAGAVFETSTKPDSKRLPLSALKRIKKSAKIPVVAIGGINKENVGEVLKTGVDGVAVASAILKAKNIQKATRELKKIIRAQGLR